MNNAHVHERATIDDATIKHIKMIHILILVRCNTVWPTGHSAIEHNCDIVFHNNT